MAILAVSEYVPDQPAYLNTGLQIASNTVPLEDGSDGPLPGPAQLTAALADDARGAVIVSTGFGTSELVVATDTTLYAQGDGLGYFAEDYAAEDYAEDGDWLALGTGYTGTGDWRFCQFGDTVIGTNYDDPIQSRQAGSEDAFADLSAAAPRGRYIATIEPGFVMVGDYATNTEEKPNGLWWSALNNAASWPTPGTAAALSVQSDKQELPLGGAITGILPAIGGAQGAVFAERAIYRIEYVGAPLVFSFREVDRSRGCVAPNSLVSVGAVAYFLSEEGFCAFDGTGVSLIGAGRVDQTFKRLNDNNRLNEVRGTVDPYRRVIVWSYVDQAGAPRWLTYSYATNRWRAGEGSALGVQCFVQRIAPGVDSTLQALATDLFGWGGFLLNEDGSYLLQENDDKLLVGSNQPAAFIAAFDNSARLVGFVGTPLEATIETGERDMDGRRIFVSGVRPLTDAADVRVSIGWRNLFAATNAYTTETRLQITGIAPQRISARYGRVRLRIPAGTAWTYLQGADVVARAEGRR